MSKWWKKEFFDEQILPKYLIFFFVKLGELSRLLEEKESLINQLGRGKTSFTQTIEELKRQLEEETKVTIYMANIVPTGKSWCALEIEGEIGLQYIAGTGVNGPREAYWGGERR